MDGHTQQPHNQRRSGASSARLVSRPLSILVLALAMAGALLAVLALSPASDQAGATEGAEMFLTVNGYEGFVRVDQDRPFFTVIVHARTIPYQNGYTAAQAWIDLPDSFGRQTVEVIWPDCDPQVFISGASGDGEFAGCLTGLINQEASSYVGPLFSFQVSCDTSFSGFGSETIRLLAFGDVTVGFNGAGYQDYLGPIIPADNVDVGGGVLVADEIKVVCDHLFLSPPITPNTPVPKPTFTPTPTATKQPDPGDTDGDGCSDQKENGPDETLGGQRDYKNPWDFYDVAIAGAIKGQDKQIDLFNDIVSVIDHYAPVGDEPEYDVWYDRGPSAGPNPWNLTAPDGKIDLFNDIVGVINQFGHDCR